MAESTRERILGGTLEFITTSPPRDLDMEDLAAWIGISRKTIYNHFPGKTDLLEQAVTMGSNHIVRTLRRIADDQERTFVERLDRIIEEGFRESHRLLASTAVPPGIMGTTVRTVEGHILDLIRRLVHEGIDDGLLSPELDREIFSHVIFSQITGALQRDHPDSLPCSPLQLLRESIRICLVGSLTTAGHDALQSIELFQPTTKEVS